MVLTMEIGRKAEGTIMGGETIEWYLPLKMAKEARAEEQYRSTDHGYTGAGLEHQSSKSPDL